MNNKDSQVIQITYGACTGVVAVASLAGLVVGHNARTEYAMLA